MTAYCGGGITASGDPAYEGEVAVLDRSIPFGTKVTTPFGVFTVKDHIGHGSDVDIYMDSCSRAEAFGRHHVEVAFG